MRLRPECRFVATGQRPVSNVPIPEPASPGALSAPPSRESRAQDYNSQGQDETDRDLVCDSIENLSAAPKHFLCQMKPSRSWEFAASAAQFHKQNPRTGPALRSSPVRKRVALDQGSRNRKQKPNRRQRTDQSCCTAERDPDVTTVLSGKAFPG